MTPESLEMIKRLVGFNTISSESNLNLINYVQEFLAQYGINAVLVPNDSGTKANLFATIGPDTEGGVVLSGHTDVVPVEGQPWSTDPFTATLKNNRLYGRGTCDMKSFIAIALAKVPSFLEAGLKKPIHLALSYDEEVGCLGAPHLIEHLKNTIAKPQAVIVGEPTSMQVVTGHKGITTLKTQVTGHEAHSSQVQRGVNAVMTSAKLISYIQDLLDTNRCNADSSSPFVPPYTTLHVGTIAGGTAVNIISRHCNFEWDIRNLPSDNWKYYLEKFESYANELTSQMHKVAPDTGIKTNIMANVPPLKHEISQAAKLLFELLDCHKSNVVPFVSEAGQFQEQGFSVALCGPGSIDQAHQPDEYIEVSQVKACEQFMDKLAMKLAQ